MFHFQYGTKYVKVFSFITTCLDHSFIFFQFGIQNFLLSSTFLHFLYNIYKQNYYLNIFLIDKNKQLLRNMICIDELRFPAPLYNLSLEYVYRCGLLKLDSRPDHASLFLSVTCKDASEWIR